MKNLVTQQINRALNRYLMLDPESSSRLRELEGKTVTLELRPLQYIVQIVFSRSGAQIQENEILVSDVKISGTPLQLLNVMFLKEDRQKFFSDDVTIIGDAEVGQQVIALFDELEIDWEEKLSQVVGDVPAYHVGKWLHHIKDWFNKSETTLAQDIDEFIHEETTWFPTREEINDLFNDIDAVSMATDRAEAKMNALKKMLLEE